MIIQINKGGGLSRIIFYIFNFKAVRSRSSSKTSHTAEAHSRGLRNSKTPEEHNEAVSSV